MDDHTHCQKQIDILREALEFYASPENYEGIIINGDLPCGEFINDHSNIGFGSSYGARARASLDKIPYTKLEIRANKLGNIVSYLSDALEHIVAESVPIGTDCGDAKIFKLATETLERFKRDVIAEEEYCQCIGDTYHDDVNECKKDKQP